MLYKNKVNEIASWLKNGGYSYNEAFVAAEKSVKSLGLDAPSATLCRLASQYAVNITLSVKKTTVDSKQNNRRKAAREPNELANAESKQSGYDALKMQGTILEGSI